MVGMVPLEISLHTHFSVAKEERSQTSLQGVRLSISSLDAIINIGLGKPKNIYYQNEK